VVAKLSVGGVNPGKSPIRFANRMKVNIVASSGTKLAAVGWGRSYFDHVVDERRDHLESSRVLVGRGESTALWRRS